MKKVLIIFFLLFFFPFFVEGLSGTISASSYDVNVGERFTITITGENPNGTVVGMYIYRDYVRNSRFMIRQFVIGSSPSRVGTVEHFETRPGTYRYCGYVEAVSYRYGVATTPNCINVRVDSLSENINDLSVSCYPSPSSPKINETVTFISSVSGGTGTYSYNWSGACKGTSRNCITRFSSSGNYLATLRVNSGSQSKTVTCPVNVIEEGSTSGILVVNPLSTFVNEPITITVKGEDKNGLISLGAHYKGEWNIKEVSGNKNENTWQVTESIPGTYRYCGIVNGKSQNSSERTIPYCMNVVVLSKTIAPNPQCSFVGESKCDDSGRIVRCIEKNGVLVWSTPSTCSINTSLGYGKCKEDERPSWYCYEGSCFYNCIYDPPKDREILVEEKEIVSVSLFVKAKGEENWSREVKVKEGERLDFLAVLKNSSDQNVEEITLSLLPEDDSAFLNHKPFTIHDFNVGDSEIFSFTGNVNFEEKEELRINARIQGESFEDNSEVIIVRVEDDIVAEDDTKSIGLAAIGMAMIGGLFRKWYFWLILLFLLFIFFYLLRKKKEEK